MHIVISQLGCRFHFLQLFSLQNILFLTKNHIQTSKTTSENAIHTISITIEMIK